jgi:hypothetical protein
MVTAAAAQENTFEAFFALDVLETALADDLRSPVCDEKFLQICTFSAPPRPRPPALCVIYSWRTPDKDARGVGHTHAVWQVVCFSQATQSHRGWEVRAHPCSSIREQS